MALITVNYNNKNSYNDFKLIMAVKPSIPKAEPMIIATEVPGRDGALIEILNSYRDIVIVVNFSFMDNSWYSKVESIMKWLSGAGDLSFSHIPERVFKVKYIKPFVVTPQLQKVGNFTVEIVCEPYSYSASNNVITLAAAGSIINPGNSNSRPLIKVYGSGSTVITINDISVTVNNLSEYVTIDSILMDCYKDTVLKNNDMIGDFPVLIPGNNSISWTGTITKIEITPNWRWMA